jgi:hypothetical protein
MSSMPMMDNRDRLATVTCPLIDALRRLPSAKAVAIHGPGLE